MAVQEFGVVAPHGTPPDVVRELNQIIVEALKLPDVRSSFSDRGANIVGNTPEQMKELVREDSARWAKVIQVGKITVD